MGRPAYYFDVDGTLNFPPRGPDRKPVPEMIEAVKRLIAAGYEVNIWTGSNARHARNFCKSVGINAHAYLTKPHVMVDDNPNIRPHGPFLGRHMFPKDFLKNEPK